MTALRFGCQPSRRQGEVGLVVPAHDLDQHTQSRLSCRSHRTDAALFCYGWRFRLPQRHALRRHSVDTPGPTEGRDRVDGLPRQMPLRAVAAVAGQQHGLDLRPLVAPSTAGAEVMRSPQARAQYVSGGCRFLQDRLRCAGRYFSHDRRARSSGKPPAHRDRSESGGHIPQHPSRPDVDELEGRGYEPAIADTTWTSEHTS